MPIFGAPEVVVESFAHAEPFGKVNDIFNIYKLSSDFQNYSQNVINKFVWRKFLINLKML